MKRSSMACAMLAGAALFSAGCAPQWVDGLPADEWLIGGGPVISWCPRRPGTAIIADKTSGKIIATRFLNADEKLEFKTPSAEEFEAVMGIPLKEARIVAYFLPPGALPARQ